MNESKFSKVESFELDHTKVKAPFVRKCTVLTGDMGDVVTKFDIRFTQPNVSEMQSEGIHTLEHLLATYLRDTDEAFASKIIDISPMGCRTGFYMTIWGEWEPAVIADEVNKALKLVADAAYERNDGEEKEQDSEQCLVDPEICSQTRADSSQHLFVHVPEQSF